MIRSALTILALVLLSSLAAGRSTALAAGTLDQSYTSLQNQFADIDSTWSFSETYTAGRTGTLAQVSVLLTDVCSSCNQPILTVEIDTSKGVVLNVVHIVPSGLTNGGSPGYGYCTWVPVTVSAPQIAGKHYAIVLSSNSPLTYGWCGTSQNGYAGGSEYKSSPPGSKWKRVAGNLDFMTYVG